MPLRKTAIDTRAQDRPSAGNLTVSADIVYTSARWNKANPVADGRNADMNVIVIAVIVLAVLNLVCLFLKPKKAE